MIQCLLKCLEEIIEYITKAAFAFQAIAGQSFITSAKNGILLNLKHGASFMFANYLANIFVFLGKIGLTCLNVFCCYMIMKYGTKDLDEVSSPWAPLMMVALTTYVTVNIFLGLFDESVMAMMTCLCADKDLNGGGDPTWGPPTFHDKVNVFADDSKQD